ncbi:MAG: Holliday junction resolvase RuvX [Clostridia bacterium]|nr:Holliday junction resolvase RuvX [Clostridia bacterium]
MIILGIDFGETRTGVAICDENQILASPLCTIQEKDKDKLAEKIIELSNLKNAKKIVLGYPKNMNGSIGESAKNVEYLQKKLQEFSKNLEIILWDERLTTVCAQKNFINSGKKSIKYKKYIDEASACLILQNYLDYL